MSPQHRSSSIRIHSASPQCWPNLGCSLREVGRQLFAQNCPNIANLGPTWVHVDRCWSTRGPGLASDARALLQKCSQGVMSPHLLIGFAFPPACQAEGNLASSVRDIVCVYFPDAGFGLWEIGPRCGRSRLSHRRHQSALLEPSPNLREKVTRSSRSKIRCSGVQP